MHTCYLYQLIQANVNFLYLSMLKTESKFTVYALYKKLQSELNAVQGTSIKGVAKDERLAKKVMIPCYKEQDENRRVILHSASTTSSLFTSISAKN